MPRARGMRVETDRLYRSCCYYSHAPRLSTLALTFRCLCVLAANRPSKDSKGQYCWWAGGARDWAWCGRGAESGDHFVAASDVTWPSAMITSTWYAFSNTTISIACRDRPCLLHATAPADGHASIGRPAAMPAQEAMRPYFEQSTSVHTARRPGHNSYGTTNVAVSASWPLYPSR